MARALVRLLQEICPIARHSNPPRAPATLIAAAAAAATTRSERTRGTGSSFMKVALVKPGAPFSIVTNVHSKRKTEVMVGFHDGERLFGSNALNLLTRKPHFTYSKLRHLGGRGIDHPTVKSLAKQYYANDIVANETNLRLGLVHHKGKDDEKVYKVEELLAMVLQHAKDITKAYGEVKVVRDCVLTVPAFFTETERAAIIDAASIAGLKVLSLIEENTAAALQYGIDRKFENGTHNVLYYNMGSNSLQVSIVSYSTYNSVVAGRNQTVGTFSVVGKGWDQAVGGSHFDDVVTEFLADEFNKQWNKKAGKTDLEIRKIQRPMNKLQAAATKTKTVLSANAEIPVFIASLYDDLDFASRLTRKQFEEKAAPLFKHITPAIDQALAMAKMKIEDINVVELLGGGVRIPRIQKELKEYFGETEIGVHLNGDEAMALGAAFHAANLSKSFRVRKVGMQDISPFAVGVRLRELEPSPDAEKPWTKRATIFRQKNKLNSRKVVAFKHARDVSVTFHYDNAKTLPPGTDATISSFNVTGVEKFAAEMLEKNITKTKIHITFWLGPDGMVNIFKAEATADYFVTPEKVVKVKANGTADNTTAAGNGTDTNSTAADEPAEAAANATATNATASNATAAEEEEDEEEPKPIKKTHRRTLTVIRVDKDVKLSPMSEDERAESSEMLVELDRQDQLRFAREAARNNLESYLYSGKDKLSSNEEDVAKVTTEEQRTSVFKSFEDTEEWLYDDGADLEASAYDDRLAEIKKNVESIFYRAKENKARPKELKKAHAFLNKTLNGTLPKWLKTKPQITATEHTEVRNATTDVVEWLAEKEAAQAKLEVHETPAFKASSIKHKINPLKHMIARLARRPKLSVRPVRKPANTTNATLVDDEEDEEEEEEAPAKEKKGKKGKKAEGGKAKEETDADAKEETDADAKEETEDGDEKKDEL
jgi:hypoxia up-regulated 1